MSNITTNATQTGRFSSTEPNVSATPSTGKKPRGFALLSKERMREVAASGGRSAHASGRAHQFTPEEASAAGKKRHAVKRAAKLNG